MHNDPKRVYKLEDAAGEPIEGTFYRGEVQPIARNIYEVERVLQEKNRGRLGKEVLVKWKGLPDKFNRWILKKDLAVHQQSTATQWRSEE